MVLQGFDPMDGTIVELVDLCKQIKSTKELHVVKKSNQDKTGKDPSKGSKKVNKKHKSEGEGSSYYKYMLHRLKKVHNTENCYALNNLMKGAKNRKKDPGQVQSKRSKEMNKLMSYIKNTLLPKKNKKLKPKPRVQKSSTTLKICC